MGEEEMICKGAGKKGDGKDRKRETNERDKTKSREG